MAVDTVSQVRTRNAFVDNVFQKTIRSKKASSSDKAFAELLSTGVVSTYGTLDELINKSLNSPKDIQPNVRDALRISAYELLFLKKQVHAVVDQGVEMVRYVEPKADKLANAVLHKMVKFAASFPWGDPNKDSAALGRVYGFPKWLCGLLIGRFGWEGAAKFMAASNEPAPVYLAVNSIKTTPQEVFDELQECGANPKFVGGDTKGCILVRNANKAVRSAALREGRAIVTDASAQLTALVATPKKGKPFLEVGSGRGTKTVLLQSNAYKYNGEQAKMCCVDIHAFKNGVLQNRIESAGLKNISLFEGDATRLDLIEGLVADGSGSGGLDSDGLASGGLDSDVPTLGDSTPQNPELFRKALIDAPCSGLGTLRRHPEIRWSMTQDKINSLAQVGLEMLKSASLLIEVGGSIVFSTCTITSEENESTVQNFLSSSEGSKFAIKQIKGKDFIMNNLEPAGPDVHFICQLIKIS